MGKILEFYVVKRNRDTLLIEIILDTENLIGIKHIIHLNAEISE